MVSPYVIDGAEGSATAPGYDPAYFDRLCAIESRHFWFRARNRVIADVVGQSGLIREGAMALEAGCGNGAVLAVLRNTFRGGTVMGMDAFIEGLRTARHRTACQVVQGDINHLPFRPSFDLIALLDVLEHLEDDVGALEKLHGSLTPRGALLLTVPARRSLWSYFDEAAHHRRRYESDELEAKLVATGYRVEYLNHFMLSLFPLVWLGRRLHVLVGRGCLGRDPHQLTSSELRVVPVLNELLVYVLALEARVARRRRVPLGTSLIALARRVEHGAPRHGQGADRDHLAWKSGVLTDRPERGRDLRTAQ